MDCYSSFLEQLPGQWKPQPLEPARLKKRYDGLFSTVKKRNGDNYLSPMHPVFNQGQAHSQDSAPFRVIPPALCCSCWFQFMGQVTEKLGWSGKAFKQRTLPKVLVTGKGIGRGNTQMWWQPTGSCYMSKTGGFSGLCVPSISPVAWQSNDFIPTNQDYELQNSLTVLVNVRGIRSGKVWPNNFSSSALQTPCGVREREGNFQWENGMTRKC